MTQRTDNEFFIDCFKLLSTKIHKNAVDKGFWDVKSSEKWMKNEHDAGMGFGAEDCEYQYQDMKKAYEAGQKNPQPNKAEKIALMHSELSEMLEGVRKPGPDQHCPEFTNEEIELADDFIRGMDYAEKFGLRLAEAILAKMAFNAGRPYRHGKKF